MPGWYPVKRIPRLLPAEGITLPTCLYFAWIRIPKTRPADLLKEDL
jgi:hypothetical protein